LPSPFAKKPQPVPMQRQMPMRQASYEDYMPQQRQPSYGMTAQIEYTHYRVPRYPDYPPYRSDSRQVYYNGY